jgi:hypothetical protein
LLTLATTIGVADVAGAPLIVVPEARLRTTPPSRTTVKLAAALDPARPSKTAFVDVNQGSGNGSTVVLVVVVGAMVVVAVVVVVVVVGVVLVEVSTAVVTVVTVAAEVTGGEGGAVAADSPAHPAATRRMPTASLRTRPRYAARVRGPARPTSVDRDELGTERRPRPAAIDGA